MPVYKDKKTNKWFAQYNYKDANGNYRSTKSKRFDTKGEASKKLAEMMYEKKEAVSIITFDKVSFEQLLWHIANLPSLAYLDIDYKLKTVKNISATTLIILVFIFITIYIDKIFLLTKGCKDGGNNRFLVDKTKKCRNNSKKIDALSLCVTTRQ